MTVGKSNMPFIVYILLHPNVTFMVKCFHAILSIEVGITRC